MVRDFADQVIVIERGRAVELGPVEQIFGAPREIYTQRLLSAGLDPDHEVQATHRRARLALA